MAPELSLSLSTDRFATLLADSGGFQVFSLAYGSVHEEINSLKRGGGRSRHKTENSLVAKVTEEGVTFRWVGAPRGWRASSLVPTCPHRAPRRSDRDGTKMLLTPESSVQAQKLMGADIILPLDELPPYHMPQADLAASLARSHRWMARRWGACACECARARSS